MNHVDRDHVTLDAPPCRIITRRMLVRAAGLGSLALVLGQAATGHDGHHGGDDTQTSVTSTSVADRAATPDASSEATPQSGGVEVIIGDLAFKPDEIEVAASTTVRWMNRDDLQHTVRSKKDLFVSGIMEHIDTFAYTFDDAGAFDYICARHLSMKGRVTLNDSATPAATPDVSPSPAT